MIFNRIESDSVFPHMIQMIGFSRDSISPRVF